MLFTVSLSFASHSVPPLPIHPRCHIQSLSECWQPCPQDGFVIWPLLTALSVLKPPYPQSCIQTKAATQKWAWLPAFLTSTLSLNTATRWAFPNFSPITFLASAWNLPVASHWRQDQIHIPTGLKEFKKTEFNGMWLISIKLLLKKKNQQKNTVHMSNLNSWSYLFFLIKISWDIIYIPYN